MNHPLSALFISPRKCGLVCPLGLGPIFRRILANFAVDLTLSTAIDTWQVAKSLQGIQIPPSTVRHMRGHKLTPTCVALSPDDTSAFSGSKDSSIVRWDVETGQRVTILSRLHRLKSGKNSKVHEHNNEVHICPWMVRANGSGREEGQFCCSPVSVSSGIDLRP